MQVIKSILAANTIPISPKTLPTLDDAIVKYYESFLDGKHLVLFAPNRLDSDSNGFFVYEVKYAMERKHPKPKDTIALLADVKGELEYFYVSGDNVKNGLWVYEETLKALIDTPVNEEFTGAQRRKWIRRDPGIVDFSKVLVLY